MTLKNLKILITGGTAGLGLELAKEFLKMEARVIITGLDLQSLESVLLKLNHINLSGFVADITDSKSLQQLSKQVGNIDVLINNAGIYTVGKLEEVALEKIEKVISTNLIGTISITHTFLPQFKAKNKGIIANILSIRSNQPAAESSIYVASKFGLRGFFESLKLELADTGIQIINFYPSGMKTNLFQTATMIDKDMANMMEPSDVASIVVDNIQRSDKTLIDHVVIQKPKRVMDST